MSTQRDPAEDAVARLVQILATAVGGLEEQLALSIEEQIRGEFGGERVYIMREPWCDKAQRDMRIRAEARAGRSIRWLACRYVLSKARVQQILAEGAPADGAEVSSSR